MTEVLIDDESVPAANNRDGGLRLRRPVLISAVVALVGAGAVSLLLWRASYAPLAFESTAIIELGDRLDSGLGDMGTLLPGIVTGPGVDEIRGTDDTEAPTAEVHPYRDGATITYAVSLHNDGPVGVTVLGLAQARDGEHLLLKPSGVRLGRRLPDGGSSVTSTAPMRRFTLAAGERRSAVVRLRFSDCEWFAAGNGQTLESFTIRYRVLGVEHTSSLDLPVRLSVRSPASCPRQRDAG